MNPAQACKYLAVIQPRAILDNSSWTAVEIDCAGWEYAEIVCQLGATDIGITALKVQENDVAATALADVTGLVFGTSNQISGSVSVLPSATDDDKLFVFQIDLRARKRYLNLVATIGDGTVGGFMAATCRLTRGTEIPITAAGFGAAQVLRV